MKQGKSLFFTFYPLAGALLYTVLFLFPVVHTLLSAGVSDIARVLSTPYYLRIIVFTTAQALLSTLAALLMGFPGAWLVSRFRFRGKKLFKSLCSVPFVLPSILVVLGFVVLYGNSGYLNKLAMSVLNLEKPPLKLLYSFKAVILAHAFYNFPVIVSVIGSFWSSCPTDSEESARLEGAGELQVFCRITMPRIAPAVASACALVFLYCFTSFAVIMVLGGGPSMTTIEVEIYRQARVSMNTGLACALSIVSLFFSGAVLVLQLRAEKLCISSEDSSGIKESRLKKGHGAAYVYLILASLFIILPLAGIVARSFAAPESRAGGTFFSLNAYKALASDPRAISNSVVTAVLASVLGTALALCFCTFIVNTGNSRIAGIANMFAMMPMAISSVILGLGYFILSRLFSGLPPLAVLVPVHSVLILPFGVRTILPAYRALPRALTEDAMTQGASDSQVFFLVHIPLLKKAVANSLSFGFAISIGELNSAVLLGMSDFPTIPTQIYRLINAYNYQGACAMGSLLIVLCFLVFLTDQS